LRITKENKGNCQVALKIEVENEELMKALDEAYRRLVNRVSIPGFRKGKTPRAILERYIGKESLFNEAVEELVPRLYRQAIEQENLDPIASPQIEVIGSEPLVFEATISLRPQVKLGDYRSIRLSTEPVEIGENDILAYMEKVREEQGAWVPVEREIKEGDLVTLDIEASVEGTLWLNHKGIVYEVDNGSRFPAPGFASRLVGAKKNEQKVFAITLPSDHPIEGIKGKESVFKVVITEIKEKQLPELNDQLAQALGYENVANMKEKIAAKLKAEAEAKVRRELRRKALDAIAEISDISYPPLLEEQEIDEILRERAQRLGFRDVEDYLQRANRPRDEIREELRPLARERLKQNLVLEKLVEENKVEIDPAVLDDEIGRLIDRATDKEEARQLFSLPPMRQAIAKSLREEKALEQLLRIVVNGEQS